MKGKGKKEKGKRLSGLQMGPIVKQSSCKSTKHKNFFKLSECERIRSLSSEEGAKDPN